MHLSILFFFFFLGVFQRVRATHAAITMKAPPRRSRVKQRRGGVTVAWLRISGPIRTCSSLPCPVTARTPLFFCGTIEVFSLQCITDPRRSKINKSTNQKKLQLARWSLEGGSRSGPGLETTAGAHRLSEQLQKDQNRGRLESDERRVFFYPRAPHEGPVKDGPLFFDLTWWIFLTARRQQSQAG